MMRVNFLATNYKAAFPTKLYEPLKMLYLVLEMLISSV